VDEGAGLFPATPEHRTSGAGRTSKPSLVQVREASVMAILQELLNGTGITRIGNDGRPYSRLQLRVAWRVDNHDLYDAYTLARRRVLSFVVNVPIRGDSKARIRPELYRSAIQLPGKLVNDCNEVRLLHGTKPDLVWLIVQNGMNERYAGASAGTAFGDGLYFADDAGKSDKYVEEDERYDEANALHQQLYRDSSSHPGSVFYLFVFRVTLGHSVKYVEETEDCFSPMSRRRELKNIPNAETPTPYHSLVAGHQNSYKEYVIFHSDQTYPEYLLAFQHR